LHLVGCLYYLYQWCTVKQISDNEIYLFIKYTKRVLWRVVKRLSYIEDARCLKVKLNTPAASQRGCFWNCHQSSTELQMFKTRAPQKPSDALPTRPSNQSAAVGGSTAHPLAQFSLKPQFRIRDKKEWLSPVERHIPITTQLPTIHHTNTHKASLEVAQVSSSVQNPLQNLLKSIAYVNDTAKRLHTKLKTFWWVGHLAGRQTRKKLQFRNM